MVLGPININTTLTSVAAAAPTTSTTTLPSNVYEVSTDVYQMAFSQGIWRHNDDSGHLNYHIRDNTADTAGAYIAGRGTVAHSAIGDLCGFLNIPNGWKATKIYIDLRTVDGTKTEAPSSVNMSMSEVTTMTTADPIVAAIDGPAALAGLTDGSEDAQAIVNNEFTFTTGLVGNVDNALWIIVNFAAVSGDYAEYIAGGYITLEQV